MRQNHSLKVGSCLFNRTFTIIATSYCILKDNMDEKLARNQQSLEHSPSEEVRLQVGDKILYKQTIVPAPSPVKFPPLRTASPTPAKKFGDNIFLFIPTANVFKKKVIEAKARAQLQKDQQSRLVVFQHDVDSGVGNQPYDENGIKGAYNRILNAILYLDQHPDLLEKNKVGTVLVGAIENYIQRSATGGPAIDHAAVVMFNATKQTVVGLVGKGVTVPIDALKEAERFGFDDEERRSGKVTVGEVLANEFGIDKADWNKVVTGVSRYKLIEEVLGELNVEIESVKDHSRQ